MKIKIYGTGCPKCRQLAENVRRATEIAGLTADIEKETSIESIVAKGIVTTPALEVDGEIVLSGRVPSPTELVKVVCKANGVNPEPTPCACGCNANTRNGGSWLRRVFTCAMLALAFGALGLAINKETQQKNDIASSCCGGGSFTVPVAVTNTPITVFYFHGNRRCMTCNKIESQMREVIASNFGDDLAVGRITIRAVNVEDPSNEHFIIDFQLTTRTIVMQKGGDYERFDKVWQLIHDDAAYAAYIKDGVERFKAKEAKR